MQSRYVRATVSPARTTLSRAAERKLAGSLFNKSWDILARKRRSKEEDEELVRTAHASAYHWYNVGNARNFSIAEWQLSRVYSELRQAELALHHAERSLDLARRARLATFYIAYGHEALARAYSTAGAVVPRDRHMREARRLASKVRDPDDRRMLEEDLATIG